MKSFFGVNFESFLQIYLMFGYKFIEIFKETQIAENEANLLQFEREREREVY